MTFEDLIGPSIENGGRFGKYGNHLIIQMPDQKSLGILVGQTRKEERFFDDALYQSGFTHFIAGTSDGVRVKIGFWR